MNISIFGLICQSERGLIFDVFEFDWSLHASKIEQMCCICLCILFICCILITVFNELGYFFWMADYLVVGLNFLQFPYDDFELAYLGGIYLAEIIDDFDNIISLKRL